MVRRSAMVPSSTLPGMNAHEPRHRSEQVPGEVECGWVVVVEHEPAAVARELRGDESKVGSGPGGDEHHARSRPGPQDRVGDQPGLMRKGPGSLGGVRSERSRSGLRGVPASLGLAVARTGST